MAVLILAALLALAYVAGGVLGGLLIDWDDEEGDAVFWIVFLIGGAVLLLAGLAVAGRSRGLAAALISLGAVAGAIATFWTIVVPVAVVSLVVLSILWARRPQAATPTEIS
ncbi:MAG: hypothetical protein M3327_11735 [Actinomycetota bacterium]|nr:hypothetical protein [Actinomycetota bacterium]